jgi:uncharacterized protein
MGTRIADIQTLQDFVTGLAFFGTGGGGGRLEDGMDMLRPVLERGGSIELASPDDLTEETWTCSVSSFGGRDPDAPPAASELATYGLVVERLTLVERMAQAVRELEEFRRVRVGALVSVELGSAATVGTILAGMALGIPTLDSDYVGRAKPEVGQSMIAMHGGRRVPMVFVDRWGNVTIVKSTVADLMADRLGRQISVAAYGRGVGASGHLFQLKDAKRGLVRESLLKAIPVGRALRVGADSSDKLRPLIEVTSGGVLFAGTAAGTDWESDEPYTFRRFTYRITGSGGFAGRECRIWVKNEHHIVWRDNKVVGTSPDILVVLDAKTNRPLSTRGEVTPGREVVVFGMEPLDPEWHSRKGHELLGPRHFGFEFDPVPLAFA